MKITVLLALAFTAAAAQSTHLTGMLQLTHGGQNAEAYWSPDGRRLIFQTTRPPYDCDQIFIMNADGSGKKQLTKSLGYDGGAVYSHDGKQLVWRAGYPKDAQQ